MHLRLYPSDLLTMRNPWTELILLGFLSSSIEAGCRHLEQGHSHNLFPKAITSCIDKHICSEPKLAEEVGNPTPWGRSPRACLFPKRAVSQKCFAFDRTQAFRRADQAQDAQKPTASPSGQTSGVITCPRCFRQLLRGHLEAQHYRLTFMIPFSGCIL